MFKINKMIKKIESILQQMMQPKYLLLFWCIVYILSIIPILMLGNYDFPCADDFTFGSRCRFVWLETHSVWLTIKQAIEASYLYYKIWAGCFSSSFFMVLQPDIFGMYWITPFIMIGSLTIGVGFFFYVLFRKVFHCDRSSVGVIVFLLLFVMVQCTPGPEQAFIWYNGASHYTLLLGITLIFYGMMLLTYIEDNKRKSFVKMCVATLFGGIVAGGNYLTGISTALLLLLMIVYMVIRKEFKKRFICVVPTIVYMILFIANIAAPGNTIRQQANQGGMSPLKTIFVSFYYVFDYCLREWTSWREILLIVISAIIFWKMVRKINYSFANPLLVIGGAICLLAATMAPSLYGTGNIDAGRISALIYMYYLLELEVITFYVTGWVWNNYVEKNEKALSDSNSWTLFFCIIVFFVGLGLTVIPEPTAFTSVEAIREIVSGEAEMYRQEHILREQLYSSGEKNIQVLELESQPLLLFVGDISLDENGWENQGLCKYYDLDSAKLIRRE